MLIYKNANSPKNLKRAAQRILKAVKNKGRIILYGDADMDGTASVIILEEAIASLGGKIAAVYFPDREKEGYGITKKGLNWLKKLSPALLIVFDCGISNFLEAKLAKKMSFELIIVDHHEILDKLPTASIIVNPKQKGDKSFKKLAAAGLAFKLAEALLGENFSPSLKESFLELVALATLADMMPKEEDNETFINQGLYYLEKTLRPGLKVFREMNIIERGDSSRAAAQKIISILNISGLKRHLTQAYILLTLSDIKKGKILARELVNKNLEKQLEIKDTTSEAEVRIAEKLEEELIFEGDAKWKLALLGAVASRICNKYQKPTFLFKKMKNLSRGAVRMPSGLNGVAIMQKCSKHLITFGGHPAAAGFTAKNRDLEKFRECLLRNYEIFTKVRKP